MFLQVSGTLLRLPYSTVDHKSSKKGAKNLSKGQRTFKMYVTKCYHYCFASAVRLKHGDILTEVVSRCKKLMSSF